MTPDHAVSIAFLRALYPVGPWMLTAISPDKKSIETRTFTDPGDTKSVTEWLRENANRNIYYSVNRPLKSAYEKRKLAKSDVDSVHYLHVDVDPRTGEDLASEQERILKQLESYKIRPTFLIFSGGGYNALWRLSEPIPIANGSPSLDETIARAADVERRNWQLELDFATPDHCRDISRILRLPGTINLPSAEKVAKGRSPALARLSWADPGAYPYAGFLAVPHVSANTSSSHEVTQDVIRLTSVDQLQGVSDRVKCIIVQGHDPSDSDYDGDRSNPLFFVCCELVRAGVPDAQILGIITDSRFLISQSVLDKGAGVMRYALRQLNRAKDKAFHPKLAEMNEKYAVIANYGGRCMIMIKDEDKPAEFLRKHEFCDGLDHEKLLWSVNGKEKQVGVGSWWFGQRRRRQYNRVVFEPGIETPGDYNLWEGFSVQPEPGNLHERYLEHMYENVCSKNDNNYNYLLGWMGRVVQKPRTQSLVAPVLLGDRGTGKSIFATYFGALFGRHYYVASDIHELTGRFNAHLAGTLFVLAEEAFDLRDKRHESVLKERITGQRIGIERKGVDIIQLNNYLHLMMTSNNERVVPAGDKERRFFVIRVAPRQGRPDSYFTEILKDRNRGGLRHLLHHLLTLDLSSFNVTSIPGTAELRQQQEYNLSPELDWLLSKLEDGYWLQPGDWTATNVKEDLYQNYIDYCMNARIVRPLTLRQFAIWFRNETNAKSRQISCGAGSGRTRPWAFEAPPLEESRHRWLGHRGWQSHPWVMPLASLPLQKKVFE